jgi:hypothetical protein
VQNREDIHYIMQTLGSRSLVSIGFSKSKLRDAGSRVLEVHPFRYILYVLEDRNLIVNLCAMRNRGWIWNGYLHGEHGDDGFLDSLQREREAGGITPDQVRILAEKIGLSVDYVQQLVDICHWDILIQQIMNYAQKTVKYDPVIDI